MQQTDTLPLTRRCLAIAKRWREAATEEERARIEQHVHPKKLRPVLREMAVEAIEESNGD